MVEDSRHAPLRALTDGVPDRHDLFIGLVAPIGSDRDQVLSALTAQLMQYGYGMERIRLADLLDDAPGRSGDPLPSRGERGYHTQRMNAGDDLRRQTGDDSAVAALAIARVAKMRGDRAALADQGADVQPVVYVFDSLKHPREARLLRNVYGPGFWLVSIVQDMGEREERLADTLATQQGTFSGLNDPELAALIRRDEGDPADKSGQQVRDVFADADYFLPVQRGVQWADHLERFLSGVFDAPFITPAPDEDAMRVAKIASLRSAALGRQVGAVVIPPGGDPYLMGTNEVPKPGGGQFQEGDIPDFRDFQTGHDPNPMYVDRLLGEVFERLAQANYFSDARNAAGGAAVLKEAQTGIDGQPAVLDGIRATSLIEFTRCLHAEQAAIVNAARTGVAVAGSRLYTTTFPCHECTKIIVGAGVIEVQYIEPYPKSMASVLYRDLIDAVPPMQRVEGASGADLKRVPFRPFLGFGPGRYDEIFVAGRRRDGNRAAEHNKLQACPIGRGWSAVAVKDKEDEAVLALHIASEPPSPATTSEEQDGKVDSPGRSESENVS